jgi:hypothetical protein
VTTIAAIFEQVLHWFHIPHDHRRQQDQAQLDNAQENLRCKMRELSETKDELSKMLGRMKRK